MMIPRDRILLDDDGYGWWVLGPWTQDDNPPIKQLDRPCDTCGGKRCVENFSVQYGWDRCPDCIDGRHTWTAEVSRNSMPMRDGVHQGRTRSVRLSVVPDMVLPIYGEHPCDWPEMLTADRPCVIIKDDGTAVLWDGAGDITSIKMPDAAKPGESWAVRVRWENVT